MTMSLLCASSPTMTVSLSGEDVGWNSKQFEILRKKPVMRMRRSPSRRSLFMNIMLGSTDPGLSPSLRNKAMSPPSHRSSWSLVSELKQPLSHTSFRQGVKIDQLIKVNEALASELADLESGKEKWLEKLKLLEARIFSNIANIDNWAVESKTKPANSVGGNVVEEGTVLKAPLAWRISLADLASIFKSSNVKYINRLPSENRRHGTALSYGTDLCFDDFEATTVLSREGIRKRANEPFYTDSAMDVNMSLPKEMDLFKTDAKCSPGHFHEDPDLASSSENFFVLKGLNDGVEVGNGLWKAGIATDVESVELVCKVDNISTRRVRTNKDPEGMLALGEKHKMSQTSPELKTPAGRAGTVDAKSFQEQSTVGNHDSTNDDPFLTGEKIYFSFDSQAQFRYALNDARKELEQLKQHAITFEKQKDHFDSSLRASERTLEEAKLDADKLRCQNELLQGMLTDRETSFESAQLALLKDRDEHKHKFLCAMQSLEGLQQNVTVLEQQKLVLESELNHFRQAFEKAKQESSRLKKEKAAIELDFTVCKQTLKEAGDNSVLLHKEIDDLSRESADLKQHLAKSQHQHVMLEKSKVELQDSLNELNYFFMKEAEKRSDTERERSNLEADCSALMIKLDKCEQYAIMLENEKGMLETALAECKQMLEGTQQQLMVLEGERDSLKSELNEVKQAFEEKRQHAISLSEEKVAWELGSTEYKQLLQETEQHVLALQSALEGTLQRADALDHQVQRLRTEKKRLSEDNENLLAFKHEQEINCRNMEAQRDLLRAELESSKNKQQAAEEALTKVNSLYASTMENTQKDKGYIQALQHQLALLEKENCDIKAMLQSSTQLVNSLETEQKALQMKLKEADCTLEKAMQELDALGAEHGTEVAALRIENSANECQIQELAEKLQQKLVEIQRLCQVEANVSQLLEKLNGKELQLRSLESILASVKLELAGKQVEIEDERSARNSAIQESNANMMRLRDLEQELSMVRGEQTGLRATMKDELVKKKELMQKLHAKLGRIKELEAALEFAKLEQNDMLMHVENERMVKEAVLEELAAIKSHSEELEEDLHKLHTEVQLRVSETEDKECMTQALLDEHVKCRELEEALELKNAEQEDVKAAWEDERRATECLLRELEQERRQRVQLEEQLKVLKAEEEHTRVALKDERTALENFQKQIDTQEARYRELEAALNSARVEQERKEQETMSKKAEVQEVWDQGEGSLDQEHCKVMKDDKSCLEMSGPQRLRLEVSELLVKSQKLEQIASSLEREGACSRRKDAIPSAVTQEVRELQSRVEDVESRLADAGYIMVSKGVLGKEKERERHDNGLLAVYMTSEEGLKKEEEKDGKNDDELLALLEDCLTFGSRALGLETHISQGCGTSADIARHTHEEIRRLKDSTDTFHQALFDAHHTALSDVSGLLVELKFLKHLLNDKTMVANLNREHEKKRGSLAFPTAALSTSALAAIGLLALLKFPKSTCS